MLAINSGKYRIPAKAKDEDGNTVWRIQPVDDWSLDYTIASTFNYTWTDGEWRATFQYDGHRVKPSPRTLRVYGAEVLQDVVLKLATNEDDNFDLDWTVLYSDPKSKVYEQYMEKKAIQSWLD